MLRDGDAVALAVAKEAVRESELLAEEVLLNVGEGGGVTV